MVEVAGMIASAVGNQVASKLGELVKDEIALLWGFKDDVDGLREKMEDLQAVLLDADQKMRRGDTEGKAVGRWLAKFKDVAYDVEDVLDDLDATALVEKTQSKVKLFCCGSDQLLQRSTIAHSMKTVRKKIHKIEMEGQKLNLVPHVTRAEGSRNKETFAASSNEGMKTGMVGRDIEKDKIISLLLTSEANEDISIIPIIGLAGLGKSTLAESVLADKSINVFDVQVWVHVSDQFDLHKIGSAIMKSINGSINLDNCTLQFLHDNLKKELATTRYLIVLDDLWEEDGDKLEELKRMLQYGCKGSRIVVTTRNQSVVKALSTGFLAKEGKFCTVPESDQISLGVLLPDDCWELMKQRALGPSDDQSGLQEIGRQIAMKCGGIPLVANALGQVMFKLRTLKAWEDIRDTKVDLGLRENKTLECLMLSYNYMKIEFKMCFTYLAAFPKGFVVEKYRLIQQWSALGYIQTEDDGERCINYLLGMSFLHISRSSLVSPGPVHGRTSHKLTMHDLVHDLASIIASNEFLVLDANSTEPRGWNRARYCRHARLVNYQDQPKVFRDLPTMARSLHFSYSAKLELPQMAFAQSKYIRVLDFSGHSVGRQSTSSNLDFSGSSVEGQSTSSSVLMPSSIHKSKLLRYLDATSLPITSLPKSFHTLKYMQTLILSKCSLETLPDNISSLNKLCHLDLSGNLSLNKLPGSLGKLSKLSFLNLLGCSMLQELPESVYELICLQHLDMSECHAIKKLPDKFGTLLKLIFLNLSGCSKITKLPDNLTLQSLEHMNLSNCHELESLPNSFGNLQKLVFLSLSDCYKVSLLPESFCKLIHLKFLDLSDCHDLMELPEYFGNLFELDSLNLTSCCKLQVLPDSFCKLLKLRHLNLSYCVRLEILPSWLGGLMLQFLDISGTNILDLPDSIRDMTTLTQFVAMLTYPNVFDKAQDIKKHLNLPERIVHKVHQIKNRGCSSIVELAQLTCHELEVAELQNVSNSEDAERAKLRDKSDLQLLDLSWEAQGEEGKSVLERLIPPRTLEHLFLSGYMSTDFPNWMSHVSTYLPLLIDLSLYNLGTCDNLPPFGQLPNLRNLFMENIPNIRKIGKEFYGGGGCTKLRYIKLRSMDNLAEWWTTHSGKNNEEFLIPNLHSLEITHCPKLKFLPYPPRSMFWRLNNSTMVLPEGGFGKLLSSALPFELVTLNCNFSPVKWDRLRHLPTLKTIEVISCNGLRELPEAMQCLTSLRKLLLSSLKDLMTLPEWLGNLTSLEHFYIKDCPLVTSLPESMKNLTALRELWLGDCKDLDILPGCLGQLISLEKLTIKDCPNLTSLPESMENLTSLRELWIKECNGLDVLPEGLGQLTSLQEFNIVNCPNLTCLPESIQNLTALKELYIWGCPNLAEKLRGENAQKISHIPVVKVNGEPLSTFLAHRRARGTLAEQLGSVFHKLWY
ncbi:disease resistance protein RGA2-like [Triticum urartu]|uniref:Disease resistance protein RGA3 n=1 Tax=Triticum urartu TaxID=4572 RepID=A0A8R7U0I6_TRIUA|nr:disease resistance protein RGA2-like [Triticum urartu]XP_048565997.1 disease resistance protein RGA2-like [Triticum urartu]XP_048565998.1 disease resistance protein RGA2-like [Triticum urartu]XP_048566000.1 disease resistance protein RGA2-like [Triticum urartu]